MIPNTEFVPDDPAAPEFTGYEPVAFAPPAPTVTVMLEPVVME
jgi:hypothetical protein